MDNSIYEVSRDEYAGYISQLKKDEMNVEKYYEDNMIITKIVSKNTGIHLCSAIGVVENEEVETHYYVFNMPLPEERIPPKPVLKVTLDTKEAVQAFFNALNKLQGDKNDRDLRRYK